MGNPSGKKSHVQVIHRLYKANKQLIALESNLYLIPIAVSTYQSHQIIFCHITTRTNYHQYSYYPITIPLWNSHPAEIYSQSYRPVKFKTGLTGYTIPPDLNNISTILI